MCRLFPCIPIFREFFLLKSVKKMCTCDYVKNRIVIYEKCIFWCEKRYKWIGVPGSPQNILLLKQCYSCLETIQLSFYVMSILAINGLKPPVNLLTKFRKRIPACMTNITSHPELHQEGWSSFIKENTPFPWSELFY